MTTATRKNTEILQDRFALKAVSYLARNAESLPHDIGERLRAARFQAVAQRKVEKNQFARAVSQQGSAGALTWGGDDGGWMARFGAFIPLAALVIGLLAINTFQSDSRIAELAEVDVALLTDALPPEAFSDPGFIQFLKTTL